MSPSPRSRRIAQVIVVAMVVLHAGHLWLGRSTGSLTDQSGVSNLIYVGITPWRSRRCSPRWDGPS